MNEDGGLVAKEQEDLEVVPDLQPGVQVKNLEGGDGSRKVLWSQITPPKVKIFLTRLTELISNRNRLTLSTLENSVSSQCTCCVNLCSAELDELAWRPLREVRSEE